MKVQLSHKPVSADALFLFVSEKAWSQKEYSSTLLPESIAKEAAQQKKEKIFEGKEGEILQVFSAFSKAKKIFFVGLGKEKNGLSLRKVAAKAVRQAKKSKVKHIAFLLPKKIDVSRIIVGSLLGNYEFKLGDQKDIFWTSRLTLLTEQKISNAQIASGVALGEAVNFTRDLVNYPPNFMTPRIMAQKAKELGKGIGNKIKVRVYGNKELQKMKMASMFGVGQGAHEESQLIVLEYVGGKKGEKPLALVGKGVCFDSGGYNLKPTGHIEEMKSDMAGAASILGAFSWIQKAQPKRNILGVIGAVENLVSGNAFKPGDVLTSLSGKTIEITNTDAEGRLVLADCLYYTATKYKPSCMVDLATLTGAAIAALGYEITAFETNTPGLVPKIKKASSQSDEEVWELPITDLFREKTKGEISDLMNWTAGVSAGSSMGAAFLENFVEKTPWVHFDLGGTAFHGKYGDELNPKGATGVMVRTLCALIEDQKFPS